MADTGQWTVAIMLNFHFGGSELMFYKLWVSKVKLTASRLATLMYNRLSMDVPFLHCAVLFTGQ